MEWTTYCAVNNHSALLTGLRHCTAKSTGDFHWGKSLRMSSRSFSATISIRQFVLCLHCAAAEQKRMHLATRAAGLVAILAVGIGIVGKTAPHLFLSVPNVGFILWAMTGNPMPPYFSPAAWQ